MDESVLSMLVAEQERMTGLIAAPVFLSADGSPQFLLHHVPSLPLIMVLMTWRKEGRRGNKPHPICSPCQAYCPMGFSYRSKP